MTGPGGNDQRAALRHFVSEQRRAALAVLEGLSEVDARRSIVDSGWTPLSMTIHLADVERHWFAFVLGGDHAHTPVRARQADTLADAIADYHAEIERSERLLDGFDLDDAPLETPPELPGEILTVRDVVLHVIEEVARHAGHLDIARELIDGHTGLGPR